MARKMYKSCSAISINVVFKNGASKHISFLPSSDGSSCYVTEDKEEQEAIERNRNFNRLFRLMPEVKAKAVGKKAAKDVAKKEPITIPVSDIGDAKNYIADHFGISRTALRTKEKILEQAKLHNIIFTGLD